VSGVERLLSGIHIEWLDMAASMASKDAWSRFMRARKTSASNDGNVLLTRPHSSVNLAATQGASHKATTTPTLTNSAVPISWTYRRILYV
jgi:hypothetical protein